MKNIKQILTIVGIVGIVVLMGFNVYYFGWLKMRENVFKSGFQSAQIQINNNILQQLNDTGELRVGIPQEDGKVKTVILIIKQ